VLTAVLDGIGVEDRGIDLGNGVLELGESLDGGPAVGDEQAPVLAREGVPDAVLEQAGRAHHERPLAHRLEHVAQALADGRRQRAGLEQALDERELLAHLLDRLVLDVDHLRLLY
jgi:hypothetical protein